MQLKQKARILLGVAFAASFALHAASFIFITKLERSVDALSASMTSTDVLALQRDVLNHLVSAPQELSNIAEAKEEVKAELKK